MEFSIIIPCYNVEKYIENTVKSVLNQTFEEFEVLLINDGSTDNTLKILEKFNDKRIKILNQENKGVSSARNLGIKNAKGKYFLFLDGDDEIDENLLSEANDVFKKKNVQMFYYGYSECLLEKKNILKKYSYEELDNKIFTSDKILEKFLNFNINQHISSVILKRELIENILFNQNLITGEDLDFQIRILLKKFNIFYTGKIFFYYLRRDNSATHKKIKIKNLNCLEALEKIYLDFPEKEKDIFLEYFVVRFFRNIKAIAINGYEKTDYIKIKNILKRYDYILDELDLRVNKMSISLNILKIIYKINLKLLISLIYLYKILKK